MAIERVIKNRFSQVEAGKQLGITRRHLQRMIRRYPPDCAAGLLSKLLVYIDDATGRLMELRFTDSEPTFDYFHSTRRYLEQHGKPVAFSATSTRCSGSTTSGPPAATV